jgi:thioredoxin reductase
MTSERGPDWRAKRNEDLLAALVRAGHIQTRFPSEVHEIRDRTVRLSTSAGPIEIPNDYVFVLIGGDPPFELLRKAGIRFGGEQAAAQ